MPTVKYKFLYNKFSFFCIRYVTVRVLRIRGLAVSVAKSPFVNSVISYNVRFEVSGAVRYWNCCEIRGFGKTEFGVLSEVLFCVKYLWCEAVCK